MRVPQYKCKAGLARDHYESFWSVLLDLFRKAESYVKITEVRVMYIRPLHF